MLLAENMGDTFVSFAGRMGMPGIAAGLTSFALMYLTNRTKVDVVPGTSESGDKELGRLAEGGAVGSEGSASGGEHGGPKKDEKSDDEQSFLVGASAGDSPAEYTSHGILCLVRVLAATAFCALEAFHGLPVYLVVLIMGLISLAFDAAVDRANAYDVLQHMPWELFSFVTGFLVLAEAMSLCGMSLWLATIFLPFAASRNGEGARPATRTSCSVHRVGASLGRASLGRASLGSKTRHTTCL